MEKKTEDQKKSMENYNYNEKDHAHCWTEEKPPCGQRIEHLKCCLCEKMNPKVTCKNCNMVHHCDNDVNDRETLSKEHKTKEITFNIPQDSEDKRRLLIDLEDKVGVILREKNGSFVVLPYSKSSHQRHTEELKENVEELKDLRIKGYGFKGRLNVDAVANNARTEAINQVLSLLETNQ